MGKQSEVARAPADPENQEQLASKEVQAKDQPPAFPSSSNLGGVTDNDEAELINFKTLHWL